MSDVWYNLDDNIKMTLYAIGYVGACLALSYAMYKVFAAMVGKAVASELIKAGIVTVL